MIPLVPTIAAAACGCVLTLVTQWLLRRRAPKAAPPPAEVPSTVEQWQPDAIRVVYEQAREYEHALLAWADAIDGKAATIFGVAAIVAGLSSTLGRVPSAGVGRALWLAALVLWGAASVACWLAFRTRSYQVGPVPELIFSTE